MKDILEKIRNISLSQTGKDIYVDRLDFLEYLIFIIPGNPRKGTERKLLKNMKEGAKDGNGLWFAGNEIIEKNKTPKYKKE